MIAKNTNKKRLYVVFWKSKNGCLPIGFKGILNTSNKFIESCFQQNTIQQLKVGTNLKCIFCQQQFIIVIQLLKEMKQLGQTHLLQANIHTVSLIKADAVGITDKDDSQSSKTKQLRFLRSECDKQKRIKRRPESILQKLRVEAPLSFQHVSNYMNMLGVNERAIRDKTFQESFFRSIFYIKSVEKVQVRKNALIIYLRNSASESVQSEKHKIQYMIQRFKSYGQSEIYQLALKLQNSYKKIKSMDFKSKLSKCFDSEPLSRYIQSMQDKMYMCKIAPNKLVISRALLQLIGEDMQSYALELCKYKTPLRQIISTELYSDVITKSVDNIGLLCDFLEDKINFENLQDQSSLQFFDYLYSRRYKKIYCKLKMHMPTPLMNCIEVLQTKTECDDFSLFSFSDFQKKNLIIQEMQDVRFREAQALKHITNLQNNMLMTNKMKTASFIDKITTSERIETLLR